MFTEWKVKLSITFIHRCQILIRQNVFCLLGILYISLFLNPVPQLWNMATKHISIDMKDFCQDMSLLNIKTKEHHPDIVQTCTHSNKYFFIFNALGPMSLCLNTWMAKMGQKVCFFIQAIFFKVVQQLT